jgi:hypothetical protein
MRRLGRRDVLDSPDFQCVYLQAKRASGCLNLAHFHHGGGVAEADTQLGLGAGSTRQRFSPGQKGR